MAVIGFILLILGIIFSFFFGLYAEKMGNYQVFIGFVIGILLNVFGIALLIDGVEKNTLLEYENGNINYKVTEIRVEDNKAIDIEVIYKQIIMNADQSEK